MSLPTLAPIVLTGYKLTHNLLERYAYPLPPIRRLIQALQRVLNIPIMFVEVEDEDDDEGPTLYVCCWVDSLMFGEGINSGGDMRSGGATRIREGQGGVGDGGRAEKRNVHFDEAGVCGPGSILGLKQGYGVKWGGWMPRVYVYILKPVYTPTH